MIGLQTAIIPAVGKQSRNIVSSRRTTLLGHLLQTGGNVPQFVQACRHQLLIRCTQKEKDRDLSLTVTVLVTNTLLEKVSKIVLCQILPLGCEV